MYKLIGIDEAGKGPVIGSMFIAFAIINLENGLKDINSYQEKLKKLGVRDSKKLTSIKRSEIFDKLSEYMDIKYAQLTPALIDKNFFNGGKLNELEIQSIIQILEKEKPNLIIIDALSSNPEKFGEDLLKKLSFKTKIISENKADEKYEIVGSASIIAKELREKEIKEIKDNIKLDCGSGYTSDKKTINFLKAHYSNKKFDFIFRKSWKTYQNFIKEDIQKSLDDF
jgi:ribonuclease HII